MPIENGELPDADEVTSAITQNAYSAILLAMELDKDGSLGTMITEADLQASGLYWSISPPDRDDYTNSTSESVGLDGANDTVYFATLYDDFNTLGNPSATKWTYAENVTSGACTPNVEVISGASLRVEVDGMSSISDQGNAHAKTNGSSGIDFKAPALDSAIFFKVISVSSGPLTTADRHAYISGSSDILIKSFGDGTFYCKLYIDYSAQMAHLYINGSLDTADIDISGAGSNWYLKFYVAGDPSGSGGSSVRMDISRIHYISSSSINYISDSLSSSQTITSAVLFIPSSKTATANGGTFSYYLSADGGSNYESVTPNSFHRFTSTGTSLKIKITATQSSSINGETEQDPPTIPGIWGVKFFHTI